MRAKEYLIGAMIFAPFYLLFSWLAGFYVDPWDNVRIPFFTTGILVAGSVAADMAAWIVKEKK